MSFEFGVLARSQSAAPQSARLAAESKRPLVYIMATDQRGRRLTPDRPRARRLPLMSDSDERAGERAGEENKNEREGGK